MTKTYGPGGTDSGMIQGQPGDLMACNSIMFEPLIGPVGARVGPDSAQASGGVDIVANASMRPAFITLMGAIAVRLQHARSTSSGPMGVGRRALRGALSSCLRGPSIGLARYSSG